MLSSAPKYGKSQSTKGVTILRMLTRIAFLFILCTLFLGCFGVGSSATESFGADGINWDHIVGSVESEPFLHALYMHFTSADENIARQCIRSSPAGNAYTFLDELSEEMIDAELAPLAFAFDPLFEVYSSSAKSRAAYEQQYEFIPIAHDALVFMTSNRNVVKELDTYTLRRIYSGTITSWQEVGGTAAQIEAFQRPWDTISYKLFFHLLMQDSVVQKPPMQRINLSPDLSWESPAGYDNSPTAIGFTLFRYATDMYTSSEMKLLAIDDVEPNSHTISTADYPFTVTYYAIFPKALKADHPVRRLVNWLLTEEGQGFVYRAGYVPLTTHMDTLDNEIKPFPFKEVHHSIGTGGIQSRENEPLIYSDTFFDLLKEGYNEVDESAYISLPWNQDLEKKLNTWRTQTRQELCVLRLGDRSYDTIEETVYIRKNLLSITMRINSGSALRLRTAVFDMKEGCRLSLSDLFRDNYNYIDYVNRTLLIKSFETSTSELGEFDVVERYLRRPFSGLPADYPYFIVTINPVTGATVLQLAFQGDNPFFQVFGTVTETLSPPISLWNEISPWGQ